MAELERVFRATLDDIELASVLPRHVRLDGSVLRIGEERIDLESCDRIVIAALGKAAFSMTESLAALLDPWPVRGVAVGPVQADSPVESPGWYGHCLQ